MDKFYAPKASVDFAQCPKTQKTSSEVFFMQSLAFTTRLKPLQD